MSCSPRCKESLIDQLTEAYKRSEESTKVSCDNYRFYHSVICNALSMAFARIHAAFYPTITGDDNNTVILRTDTNIASMQAVSISVEQLLSIAEKVKEQALLTDFVHIITDNDLTTAYLIEPHLTQQSRQIHCTKSIYNHKN